MHYRVPGDTEMTPEVLAKYIGYHKKDVAERLSRLDAAYRGDYEIYHQKAKPKGKPDNRIAAPFAKYMTDTFNGFFCGIPIKTSSDNDAVADYIEKLDAYNNQDDGNSELSKLCDIFGSAHEMYFLDEDAEEGIAHVSPMNSFFLVSDSITPKPLFFVYYYLDSDHIERGSWSDSRVVQHVVNRGSWRWDGEETTHGFDGVPAVEYSENEEQIGLFESVLSMINSYNKALSDKANDVDYFSDAYMKIIGKKLTAAEIAGIRDGRVVNMWNDNPDSGNTLDAGFMQRPSGDTTQENHLNRLAQLIFQLSGVANISDENFAGNSSGIALRYKLLAMSNLAKTKERKFRAGMANRYRLLFSNPVIYGSGVQPDDWMNIDFQFTMNYPANISDEADTAVKLDGVVSKETQLKVLSIVDNPKDEMDKIQKENEEQMDSALNRTFNVTQKQASTYEITSILSQVAKGTLGFDNAVMLLERLGFDEESAKKMINDQDSPESEEDNEE